MKYIVAILILFLSQVSVAQNLTQTVRGSVKNQNTQEPLIGATIKIVSGDFSSGDISDENGNFRVELVPVGRVDISIEYIGYEKSQINQLEVTSTKEIVLTIELIEKVVQGGEVVIRARRDKSKTLNKLVSVSGRTFSIEESQRYAGSKGDVVRMAQNFAGVQGADDSRNDIVVRGNSPMGVLYRLNGVDIPNPNHFSSAGTTGGPISMLNNNVLSNSDFLTGAFPAEYGNATAAVFDLGMRKGNNEQYEYLGQIGFAGFELMAEGPINKSKGSSFLVNYRYSALGLFSLIGLDFGTGSAIPKYQDASFNLHFPDKNGYTQIFGLGGLSKIELFQSESAGENLFRNGLEDLSYTTNTGVLGATRFQRLNKKTLWSTTIATDAALTRTHLDTFSFNNGDIVDVGGKYRDNSSQGKYSINSYIQHSFNSKNTVKAGVRYYHYFFSLNDSFYSTRQNVITSQPLGWVEPTSFSGNTGLVQSYVNLNHRFTSKLKANVGINYAYFTFNGSKSLEPRGGITYKVNDRYSISAGYGLHSQLAPFRIYFEELTDSFGIKRSINQDLGFTKSHHFVIANDINLGPKTRLKIEAYYQLLFDVPIDGRDEVYYSLLNQGTDFGIDFTDSMVNNGFGRNYGVEITLERFLNHGFYYLNTLSVYRSFYTDQNGDEHSTAFDSRYALNLLGGKEFYFKEKTNKKGKVSKSSLTTDVKFMLNGGKRYTPFDTLASANEGIAVRDLNQIYANQYDDYIRFDLRIGYKVQGEKVSQEWGIDIQNLTNRRNIFQQTYNASTNEFRTSYQTGLLPIGFYRILF